MNVAARDWALARARALELLGKKAPFDEAEHPRDEHGRWTDGGGGDDDAGAAPKESNAAVKAAIGEDLYHPNLFSLKDKVERGAWDLTVEKVKESYGQKITTVGISAPIPSNWVKGTNPTGTIRYYDPAKAAPDADGYIAPKVDTEAALPKTATPGVIYRGMSYEEYQGALKNGQFASRGDYNLGEAQKGLTYYSSDPDQAASYAHGFAPSAFKAVPGRPAVIVGVADPGDHYVVPQQPTELGIRKPVPTSAIREVYLGEPIIAQSGFTEVIAERGRPPMEGSGSSPSITVAWRKDDAAGEPALAEPDRKHPGEGYSKEATVANGVIYTNDVYDAVLALSQDRRVELEQPRTASILIEKLGAITKDMIAKGEKAPTFDLCNVTIKATSLFCADAHGIPRVEMPQIGAGQEDAFRAYLEGKGYKVERQDEFASYLRATQNELNGAKVARVAGEMSGKTPNPIFISSDSYILDGHHRWAAEIGKDAVDNVLGNDKTMAVMRVGATITQLLHEAEVFTEGKGKLSVEDSERRKAWAAAKARAMALLHKFDPSQPRDEHGRWMDAGGSDDDPKAKYDIAKIEAKTHANVAVAAALSTQTPLPGSKATHPATIATRNPTAVKGTATPKGVYGQPDVKSMKLEPERFAHDIGLFANADFYPNFRKEDFKDGTDAAADNIVTELKDNLKFLYQFADKHTEVWYDGARALVDDRAKLWGFNEASVAAVYAALSPTKDWDQNVHIADMLMKTYKFEQATKWDAKMTAKAKTLWSAKLQPLVQPVVGKTLGELTDPKEKAIWIRTFNETHGNRNYREVLPNGALGKIVMNDDGKTPTPVVWQSLPFILGAVKSIEAEGDRDKISDALPPAHKVRSFYNNILDPHSANDDVTIDTHAVGAALLRQISNKSVPVAHNFGNTPEKKNQPPGWDAAGSSTKTGLSGLYAVYADAYRAAAKELGIQPRQLQSAVWVVKRQTFGELSKKDREAVDALWHSYHDGKATISETRDEIAKIVGLKHDRNQQRNYGLDEAARGRADPRELHRAGVGPAAAGMDRRAGAGAAEGIAGLVQIRGETWRIGPEVEWLRRAREKLYDEGQHPRDEHGRWTDSGAGDSSTPTARPPTSKGAGASDKAFAKIRAAVNAIPIAHAAQIAHVPVALAATSDEFPSHIAAGGGSSTVGLFGWAGNKPRIDIAEAIKATSTITEPAAGGQPAQSQQIETLLPIRQPEQVTVHELAHAFDYVNDWKPSADPGLNQSFNSAVAKMTETEASNAQYWIGGGQREMFAELYSALYNPNRDSNQTYFGGMSHARVSQLFEPAIEHVQKIKLFDVEHRAQPSEQSSSSGYFVNEAGELYVLINGVPYALDVAGTALAKLDLVPGSYPDLDAVMQAPRTKSFDESEHPRDDHGRWTDSGGGDDAPAPSPSLGTASAKLAEILPDITGELATNGGTGFLLTNGRALGMDPLTTHNAAASKVDSTLKDVLNEGTGRLHALPRTEGIPGFLSVEIHTKPTAAQVRTLINAAKGGAYEHFFVDGYGGKSLVNIGGDGTLITPVKVRRALDKAFPELELGFTDEQVAGAMEGAMATLLKLKAEAVAKKLDFDPKKIVYTDEDLDFTLGGQTYKYAGSYQRGEPDIKLYNRQITPENIKGITAHEIGHRKFEMLRNQLKVQTEIMMADPGPPPDPNHQYWWGKKGGSDAIMNPQGEMRPPYDEKYPIVHEWAQIQNLRPSLEQTDGITDYSKKYWAEWEKGAMPTDTAYHETMAEMSRNLAVMGKHSAVTASGWRRLYRLQEKVWAKTEDWQRDMSMNEPIKAIYVLDGVRWEVR